MNYGILKNMKVEIVKMDNLGRGIGYINNKIVFIPKTYTGDIVEFKIEKEKNKFIEGKLLKIISPSKRRIAFICPYFNICGGCDLQHISLTDSLEYKLTKVNDILHKNNIAYEVKEIIKNDKQYNYRNKISLKIINGELGFYESDTHKLITINKCFLVSEEVNKLINDLHYFNIKNGNIIIRENYKQEIMLIIESNDSLNIPDNIIQEYKIVGIIYNDNLIYGDNYFIDKINDKLFKVSYNSFFQVNPYMNGILGNLVKDNTKDSLNVLDLYCGVGSLSLASSDNNCNVLGVEIVENAILNAQFNAKLNNKQNVEFICSDTKKILDKITHKFDTVILDPPRSGVNKLVLDKIKEEKILKIIYISCNEFTFVRDLNYLLNAYQITELKLLDMFVNTEHVESFCILNLK